MKVSELKSFLEGIPDDMIVVMQKDAEGNGYSPLAGAEAAAYEPETTWSGQVIDADYLEGEDPEEIQERLDAAEPCVVLWPVN